MAIIERRQRTILIVDDDPVILKYVSGILADVDYHVLTASSGEAALQQSRDYKGHIDLLLSDFQMPVMSGIELATQMSMSDRNSRY